MALLALLDEAVAAVRQPRYWRTPPKAGPTISDEKPRRRSRPAAPHYAGTAPRRHGTCGPTRTNCWSRYLQASLMGTMLSFRTNSGGARHSCGARVRAVTEQSTREPQL